MRPVKEAFVYTVNIILYTLILLFKVYGTKDVVTFRITNYHMCVTSDDLLYTLNQVSIRQCVEECASQPDCSAVSYRRFYQKCEIHSTFYGHFVGNAFTKGPCTFINKSDIFIEKPLIDCDLCAIDGDCDPNYCARKFCHTIKLENGALLGNMKSVGSRVEYTCSRYFVEEAGETHSTCQVNGSWTHEPICSGNFKYMGCYIDKKLRILYEAVMGNKYLTTEICVNYCFELGYMYASTQYRTQCFCGNTLRNYPKVPDSWCNTPCAGDPKEMCGGVWRGSVYKGTL